VSHKLPRPQLVKNRLAFGLENLPELAQIRPEQFADPAALIWQSLKANPDNEDLRDAMWRSSQLEDASEERIAQSIFNEYLFQRMRGVVVEFSPRLVEQLHMTDLPLVDRLPFADWRLPFDTAAYFHMPTPRSEVALYDDRFKLEGFYIRPVRQQERGVNMVGFEVRAIAQPAESAIDETDVQMQWTLLGAPAHQTDSATLGDILDRFFANPTLAPGIAEDVVAVGKQLVRNKMELLLKALIYVNLKETRIEVVSANQQLQQKAEKLGPKKRARILRKLERAYDRVTLDVAPVDGEAIHGYEGASRKPHWRRGHFRNQRYGRNWSESRMVWIRPIIVGYGSGAEVEIKRYAAR